MARVSLCPHYTISRSGFAKLSQADRGPGRFPFRSVCRPYQRQSKSKAKCTRGARRFFSLSLILPGRRRTLNLRRITLRALPAGVCVALRALTVSLQLQAISLRILHARRISCTSSRLSSPLVSRSPWLRQVVLS